MNKLLMIALLGFFPLFAADGDDEKKPWTNKSELSAVWTGGNSESESLGFSNTFTYAWERSGLKLDVHGLRAESTNFTRRALGMLDDFQIIEDVNTEKTAENYSFDGKYDQQIGERLFWYVSGGWDRNEFAGIKNRFFASGGLGHQWRKTDTLKFRTEYGIEHISEEPVTGEDEDYLAGKLAYNYFRKLTATTSFEQAMKSVINFDETDDLRVDLDSNLNVTISEFLALSVSLKLAYDNQPQLELISLPNGGEVSFELDDLDTIFTTSLVVNF